MIVEFVSLLFIQKENEYLDLYLKSCDYFNPMNGTTHTMGGMPISNYT